MGATVTGCSSLIAGITGAGNRPGASPVTGNSVDDEVVNMVIPPTTSTSAALATRASAAPGVPTTSPAPRLTHLRAPRAYPDCRAGAESSSPPWFSPFIGVTGWSAMAATGGAELVTGWKRSATWRARGGVEGFEQLTKTRSLTLTSVHRADPCGARPETPDDWVVFTAA